MPRIPKQRREQKRGIPLVSRVIIERKYAAVLLGHIAALAPVIEPEQGFIAIGEIGFAVVDRGEQQVAVVDLAFEVIIERKNAAAAVTGVILRAPQEEKMEGIVVFPLFFLDKKQPDRYLLFPLAAIDFMLAFVEVSPGPGGSRGGHEGEQY